MPRILPPVPYKTQVLTPQGLLSEAWSRFFRQLFFAIGGRLTSTTELTGDVAFDLQLLNQKIEDLNQGRQL